MQKLIPKLTRFVAIQKLEEHYSFTNQQAMQLSAMRLFAEELCAQESYARHFIFRIMKAETDHTLVNAVLQSLPEDYQKYIKLKYIGHKNVVGLATSLYTSPSQLNVWHDKIVTQVQNALSYRLARGDIYDYRKIINMLEVLAKILATVESIDPEHEIVDNYWVNAIGYYYNNYRSLFDELENCVIHAEISNVNKAVALAKDNPFLSKEDLAKLFGCSSGTYGRYLMEYIDKVRDFVYS